MIGKDFMFDYCNYVKRKPSNKVALLEYDRNISYTYDDLEDRANRLANYMKYELGLVKGDVVAICARNSVEIIDVFLASSKIGVILTTYNCMLRESELIQLIINEAPKVIFYDDIYINRITKIRDKVKTDYYILISDKKENKIQNTSVVNINKDNLSSDNNLVEQKQLDVQHMLTNVDIDSSRNYYEIMTYNNEKIQQEIYPEDIHMLIHTGGTTGIPKAAKISYRSIYNNAISEIKTLSLSEDDIAYTFLPLFHTAGWNIFTIPLLFIGGKIIFTKEFKPKKALKIFNEEKPTVGLGVSTIFRMFINEADFKNTDFSSLRFFLSGAAPTPRNIIEKFLEKGVKIGAAYGMTESGPNNIVMNVEHMDACDIKERWDSVGKPMLYNQVKIVDSMGNEVDTDEVGELIFKGDLIFSGYYNNKIESRNTLVDGWVYTGDMAKRDKDGFYYIVGRRKNMFITGGENIFPTEIEEVIYKHPAVHEVCVIGVKDEKWGEVGKAIIVLKDEESVDNKELKEFVKQRISSIKVPKYYEVVDCLFKNSVGKIEIEKIKKAYGQIGNEELVYAIASNI